MLRNGRSLGALSESSLGYSRLTEPHTDASLAYISSGVPVRRGMKSVLIFSDVFSLRGTIGDSYGKRVWVLGDEACKNWLGHQVSCPQSKQNMA